MKKGRSIHIGLNYIDANHYGTSGTLKSCEKDAKDMKKLADSQGYESQLLLSAEATYNNVRLALLNAAEQLHAGDMLMLSYSGHGASIDDLNKDEDDGKDETWVLFDRMMVDDELNDLYAKFRPGVRIQVISDSCHSGTVTKFFDPFSDTKPRLPFYDDVTVCKMLDPKIANKVFRENEPFYKATIMDIPKHVKETITASVLLLGACQDNQLASDGFDNKSNSKFTEILLKVWKSGQHIGSYPAFHQQIHRESPPNQTPSYYFIGISNPVFENQQVFIINSKSIAPPDNSFKANKIQWVLEIDEDLLKGVKEMELSGYINDTAVPLLIDTYNQFRQTGWSITGTKGGGEVSGGCSVSDRGWSCDVRGSIRF